MFKGVFHEGHVTFQSTKKNILKVQDVPKLWMLSHNRTISVPSYVPVTYSELFFLKSTFILSFQLLPSLQPGQSPRNFLKVCISYLPHTNRMSNTSPNILSCIKYHVPHYAKTSLPFLSLFSPGVFPLILPSNEETTLYR